MERYITETGLQAEVIVIRLNKILNYVNAPHWTADRKDKIRDLANEALSEAEAILENNTVTTEE